jgi:probable phosphoglycerate mutase
LHLIRHGETIWHKENRYAGHTDVALTEKGIEQASRLRSWARGANLDAVISSDLSRAVITAEPVCEETGLALITHSALREVNFGRGEGLTAFEMKELFPSERSAFEKTPASNPFPEGESGIEAVKRSLPIIHNLISDEKVNNALFVTHSTLARLLLCEFLGVALDRYRTVFPKLVNGAVTSVGFEKVEDVTSLRGKGSLLEFNNQADFDPK